MNLELPEQPLQAQENRTGDLRALINADAAELSARLNRQRLRDFPPSAQKSMRRFSPQETSRLLGIHDGYLRQLVTELKGPQEQGARRSYTLEDISSLRSELHRNGKEAKRYLPHRKTGEPLQILSVMNFKGGSGKTTTTAHLAQYLAFRGYRVLAIDLDPQASLSALFGHTPEFDVGENETIYGAIRYGTETRPVAEIVRGTYIPNLHLIPGQLELMEFEHETPKALLEKKQGTSLFFARLSEAIAQVGDSYDVVVIDCPPQLGFLTLSALCAATSVLITVHPQMLDVMSMSQFLTMTGNLLDVVANAGGNINYDWMRYLVTRYEPSDGPQTTMVGLMRSIFGSRVLTHPMLKSTAISDAGLTNQTLYEIDRQQFTRGTYDRAIEALDNVNGEIELLIKKAWGRG
jgi:chromosome partitioning protein